MKIDEYKKLLKKKSKYRSNKSGGYDSKKEHNRAITLHFLERQGIISNLREQVRFELIPNQYIKAYNGKTICARRSMSYIADFVYTEKETEVVEDCKGFRTSIYKQKKRLMKRIYNIEIKET